MKYTLYTIILLITTLSSSYSQSAEGRDPLKSIALNPYSSDNNSEIPTASHQKLSLKLRQIADLKSIGSSLTNPRFIITAIVNVTSKDITPTAPPMIAVNLEVNFFIGDGNQGKIFAYTSKSVKGVGTNETKAYNNAINNIKPGDPEIRDFVRRGKLKIVDYYDTKCDEVIMEADQLAAANKYDDAVYRLMLVPEECKICFEKCLDKLREIVPQKSKYNCESLLLKAKAQWAASLDTAGANSAVNTLSQIGIDINKECNKEIKNFIAEMSKTMKERNNKEWEYKGHLLDEKEKTTDEMKAFYKEIAVEHSKKQNIEPVHYNINTWQKN